MVRMDSCVGGEGGRHWAMQNYTIYLRQLVEICSSTEHVSDMLRVVDMCILHLIITPCISCLSYAREPEARPLGWLALKIMYSTLQQYVHAGRLGSITNGCRFLFCLFHLYIESSPF